VSDDAALYTAREYLVANNVDFLEPLGVKRWRNILVVRTNALAKGGNFNVYIDGELGNIIEAITPRDSNPGV
jgi:hypothetical protein